MKTQFFYHPLFPNRGYFNGFLAFFISRKFFHFQKFSLPKGFEKIEFLLKLVTKARGLLIKQQVLTGEGYEIFIKIF